MIGLAIGIDYSLLMVTYYRENGTGRPSPKPWPIPSLAPDKP